MMHVCRLSFLCHRSAAGRIWSMGDYVRPEAQLYCTREKVVVSLASGSLNCKEGHAVLRGLRGFRWLVA